MRNDEDISSALVRRVEYWTVGLGMAGALLAGFRWSWRAGAGVAAGALLSWLNYRWLKQGVMALTAHSLVQAGTESVRVPKRVWVKFFGRFVLLFIGAYVILSRFDWPATAVLSGLFAAVAGVVAESVSHLLRSLRQA